MKWGKKNSEPAPSEESDKIAFRVGMWMSWSFFLMFLMFYGVIWFWSNGLGKSSLVEMHQAWRGFQAKIDTSDALARLTTCLHEVLPDHNATVADFSGCLKAMGMSDAPVG